MHASTKIYKDHTRLYWSIWILLLISIIVTLLVIRFFSNGNDGNLLFNVFFTYLVFSWLPIAGVNIYEMHRLIKYLKSYHAYTLHISNASKFIEFVFSENNFGDSVVEQLKSSYKRFFALLIVVFLTTPILFVAMMSL